MSDSRGRGMPRGQRGDNRGNRGGSRGGLNPPRGDGSRGGAPRGRGDFRGRGDSNVGANRGQDRGGFRGRGDYRGRGEHHQMAFRSNPTPIEEAPPGIFLENAPVPAPDSSVTTAENARVKETRNKMVDVFPGRPGYGTQGRAIVLRTNYFTLTTAFEAKKPEIALHRYSVSSTETLSKAKARRLIEIIVGTDMFQGVIWASDYSGIIVTTKRLELGPSGEYKGKIELIEANEVPFPPPQATDPLPIQQARERRTKSFKIEYTNSFTLRQLVESLRTNAPGSYFAAKGDIIQLLNIIMAKHANAAQDVYSFSQNKFYPDRHPLMQEYSLREGLRALRGYYASVRTATHRILLNLNVSSAAFYNPIPLRDLMNEYLGTDRVPRDNGGLERLEGFLRLLRVETRYLKPRDASGKTAATVRKTKTILSFAKHPRFGNARNTTFLLRDANNPQAAGRSISVFDYFKQEHGITLIFWNEPVLNVGSQNDPVYLPVELAFVMPGQAVRRLLTGKQTADMIKFAARAPNLNAISIAGTPSKPGNALVLMGLQADAQENTVHPFGFSVGTEMITVPGRILESPKLQYGKGGPMAIRDGSWNAADKTFVHPGTIGKWSCMIINFPGHKALETENLVNRQGDTMLAPEQLLKGFEEHLRKCALKMGQRMNTRDVNLPTPNLQNRAAINKLLDHLFEQAAKFGIEMLLVVIPENDKWLYSRIKYYGDIKYGIQTINVVGSKFQKPRNQGMYFGNVALKFNIKGGGVAHTIPEKTMSPLDQRTMLVGIDVTHPSPTSKDGSPSIAGVVASIDSYLCQWPGSLRSQTGRQEMVEGLAAMMGERLDLWHTKHKSFPNKIIIYRDGVSEGQYRLVLDTELPAVREAFEQRYGVRTNWPKVTIVIVGKRHHTRFYPTRKQDADTRSWNPLPGTVVDRGVTDHFLWDFYLQAHQGLQGTARPAHYVVIMDEIKFEQDQLEAFTHRMCYLFNRATKAVSICPPAYYADLICERGRAYLYTTLNENRTEGGSAYSAGAAEWTSGVHPKLAEKTFYI